MHVFLAEDDSRVVDGICSYFRKKNAEVVHCATKEEAYDLIEMQNFDVAILDIMLGEGPVHVNDGFYICERLHRQNPGLPVIIVSGRTDEMSMEHGYALGCHEYVPKPCSYPILYLKAKAMVQLAKAKEFNGNELNLCSITINTETRRCFIESEEKHLTQKQFDLLHYLMVNAGKVISRESLLSRGWDYHSFLEDNRVVDQHISRMKKTLGEKSKCIECIQGVGYRFNTEG